MVNKSKPKRRRGVVDKPDARVLADLRAARTGPQQGEDQRSDAEIARDAEQEAARRREAGLAAGERPETGAGDDGDGSGSPGGDAAGSAVEAAGAAPADSGTSTPPEAENAPSAPENGPAEPAGEELAVEIDVESPAAPFVGAKVMFHSTMRRAGRRDHAPVPAIVTAVRDGKCSLTVFGEGFMRYVTKIDADRRKDEHWSWPRR